MELREYARILVRRGWIILLVSLVTAASAIAFAKTQKVTYRSSAILQVIPAQPDIGVVQVADQLLRQYGRQITTVSRARKVIDKLELDLPPRTLLNGVKVAPISEDFLIRIDVDLPTPEEARNVANALAQDFVEYHAAQNVDLDKRDRINILILEEAEYGSVQWPKVKTLALAGAIFGLLLGAILAFALEYLESDVIRSSEDVERYVGVAVLGLIPVFAAGKAGSWSAKIYE